MKISVSYGMSEVLLFVESFSNLCPEHTRRRITDISLLK